MTQRAQADALLTELGAKMGLLDLKLDADGAGALVFDDQIVVNLHYNPNFHRLVLFTALGTPAGKNRETILAELLKANFLWQGTSRATLALDSHTDSAVMFLEAALVQATALTLEKVLETFINTAEYWIDRIKALQTDS